MSRAVHLGFREGSHAIGRLLPALALCFVASAAAADTTDEGLEFFEKQIRPILVEHCYECHSGRKTESNLRLDRATGWLRGGDSGPAVMPGKPDESLLLRAVRYEDAELEMPPSGKLPADTIGLLAAWVASGAPAPPDPQTTTERLNSGAILGKGHWAYQPPRDLPPEDSVAQPGDPPLDRFIHFRLRAVNLQPQPEAARAVLVRRLYFDLLGLPPEPAEIDSFENDPAPDAYERLVDRLLSSPAFGERWGRHWLDLVRFAESVTLRGLLLPEAWRYRDYVIDSFNRDVPFDQFLREHIAGDLLPADTPADRQRQRLATTFLTLGNTNLEEQDKRQLEMDVVDEQLDVIGKAILGQTIGCARCHDHKFDPIPTRDYYALAGILRGTQALEHANVSKWIERPLPLPPDEELRFAEHESKVRAITERVAASRKRVEQLNGTTSDSRRHVVLASDLPGTVIDDRQAKKVGHWQDSRHTRPYVNAGYVHDLDQGKGEKTITFAAELPRSGRYEVRFAYTPGVNRAKHVPVTVFSADGENTVSVNMTEMPPLDGCFVSLGEYRFEVGGQCFVLVSNDGTRGHVVADAVQFLPGEANPEAVAPTRTADATTPSPESVAEQEKLKSLEGELKKTRETGPKRPMVMTIVERSDIQDVPIHRRGSVHALGEVVPRGFLQAVPPFRSTPLPKDQSGRRELADWLASAENPLTARVFVNRVWHWLFGAGLVRTVDNFGATGELPSHPELLDHLACTFVAEGWSIKRLVRYVVLSNTYRRSSAEHMGAIAVDPENRLYWRANRKRLDAECLRDSMLAISGQLQTAIGGPGLRQETANDYDYTDSSTRRSIYVPVLRNSLPELFTAFDFPDTSMVVGARSVSTVAPQALFMMNHPWVRAQATAAAERLVASDVDDDAGRVGLAFRRTLGRAPTDAEREVARQIVSTEPAGTDARTRAYTDLFHLLFMSLDFRYCD